jgi:lycopene cyclase domain-containing protein
VTYTALAVIGVVLAVALDLALRTRLIVSARFWFAWAILVFFQLISNGWLTGLGIVQYSPEAILGLRLAYAPIEDLAFGFALILTTLCAWRVLARKDERPSV